MANWGYCKSNGPHCWEKYAPAAKGSRQSPINIVPAEAVYDAALAASPLKMVYDASKADKLINTGHSAQVTFDSAGSSLTGGPLSSKYQVAQYHLHWGKTNSTGSEHRINNEMFAAELHIVHWNTELFKSAADAMKENNGLCVLGMFVKVGKEHAGLKTMTDQLSKIEFSGDSVSVGSLNPASLLPSDTTKYWTYLGSLTTPPLYESVTWVVFKEPIEVSQAQMDAFRNMKGYSKGGKPDADDADFDGFIVENYRPPLPRGNRTLRASFQ
jgi:carbonic anhydrase